MLQSREMILRKKSELSSIHSAMNKLSDTITHENIEELILECKQLFRKHKPHSIVNCVKPQHVLDKNGKLLDFPYSYTSVELEVVLGANNQIDKGGYSTFLPRTSQLLAAGAVASLGVGAVLLFKYKPWQAL